jgi:long-chain acyl-CoA synthetase
MNTIISLWQETERRHPQKIAFIGDYERVAYGQAGEKIRRLATMLTTRWGLGPGGIVGLLIRNSVEFVVSYFAVIHTGAIVQPLDERLMPNEICAALNDSKAPFIIVHRSLWPKFEAVREKLVHIENILGVGINNPTIDRFEDWTAQPAACFQETTVSPGNVAELMYTSGTTGMPKGVMRTHANARAISRFAIRGFGYRSDDIIAIVMPMSHSSALASQMMPFVEIGGTIVLIERFDPSALIDSILAEGVTCLRAVPTIFRALLRSQRFCAGELASLRLLMNSSAAIDPETYIALKKRFPRIEIVNSYGLTEASTNTILPDSMALKRPDSIGTPIEGIEMAIRDDQGNPVEVGAEGEIWVRGEHVFLAYWQQPEVTRAAITEDGWLRTGDLGHCDSECFYYFHGRKDDLINCGGRKYSPLEVENCILELPEVADVAVLGVPHKILGQVAKAYVVFKPDSSHNGKEIARHCARRLASHKVPFFVEGVLKLPKNSVGKILYKDLRNNQEVSYK